MEETQKPESFSLIDYLKYPARSAQWDMIMGEVHAVQDAYAHWKEEIPDATQQRMARRIVAFRQEWQGYKPDFPLEEASTLTERECSDPIKSFNDLLEHHNLIEAHYGHPDKVPGLTRKAMKQEEQEFQQEIATYKDKQRQEFLTRLSTNKEQQPQQKPK